MLETCHCFAFVVGGAIEDYHATAQLIRKSPCVISVDGGLEHCQKMGILPDMIMGDLDSAPLELLREYADVPMRSFPMEKDESDLELAMQSIFTPAVEKMIVFGGLGRRLDHTLANLHLMRRYPGKCYFETERELIFALDGPTDIPCHPGQTISFMQMDDNTKGVTSQGLKWELRDATFSKYFFSLSNICLDHVVKITLASGDLICCLQK